MKSIPSNPTRTPTLSPSTPLDYAKRAQYSRAKSNAIFSLMLTRSGSRTLDPGTTRCSLTLRRIMQDRAASYLRKSGFAMYVIYSGSQYSSLKAIFSWRKNVKKLCLPQAPTILCPLILIEIYSKFTEERGCSADRHGLRRSPLCSGSRVFEGVLWRTLDQLR